MSSFLLQKSLKLTQNKPIRKTKKAYCQKLKKKKNLFILKQLEEEKFQENILKNLKTLEKLNEEASINIPEETLCKCSKSKAIEKEESEEVEKEEGTIFTDKDFEDFEKEYFGS